MKRIILLIDALNFKAQTLDFAAFIAKQGKSKLVGVFAEKHVLDASPSLKTIGGQVLVEEITEPLDEQRQQRDLVDKNMKLFTEGCEQREINSDIKLLHNCSLETLINETRYADLLITDPAFSMLDENVLPSKFIMELLNKAECPVLIAPDYFDGIEDIVLAFDGSASSVFAIKQFYYQLHELANKNVHVLHISDENKEGANTKEYDLLTDWLHLHFAHVSFINLKGNARDIMFEYFMTYNEHSNKMLVTGAFGRSLLSSFFKPSAAELVC